VGILHKTPTKLCKTTKLFVKKRSVSPNLFCRQRFCELNNKSFIFWQSFPYFSEIVFPVSINDFHLLMMEFHNTKPDCQTMQHIISFHAGSTICFASRFHICLFKSESMPDDSMRSSPLGILHFKLIGLFFV